MAIYHNSFQIIKRSEGRSAVAAAAYRAGENLVDRTTGLRHDERKKGSDHVIWSEILLPQNAPEEWRDRETLWNAVERSETGRNAQLAREFNVALPYECTRTEWIEIAREYGQWFADQGMCVDLAIHTPDHKIPNPHIHGMLTMRGVDRNGQFAKNKTRTVYRLDQNGEKIPMPAEGTPTKMVIDHNGDMVSALDFDRGGVQKIGQRGRREYHREKRHMNDWDSKEFLIAARTEWADVCNRRLDLAHQIDHRSYKEQGIDKTPTTHDGVAARAIYQKMLRDKKYRYDRRTRNILPRHFSYIDRYTIDGRRRTEIEMILFNFLAVITLLLDMARETGSDRVSVLERMQWDVRTDIACMNEYGVTRKLEQRTEMYAACTVRELKKMIREKERRLGELKKEIAIQEQSGHSITPEQKTERGELFSELRVLRTAAKEKEEVVPPTESDGLSEEEEAARYWAKLEAERELFERESQWIRESQRRGRQRALEITANDGQDLQINTIPSLEKVMDRMRAEYLNIGLTEDYRAITLITMLRAAENEREHAIARVLHIAIEKYHRGEIDIKEAQRMAVIVYSREISEREWSKKMQAQAVAAQPQTRRRRDDMER